MKRVKIAELKSQLSRHLRSVERGVEIEVTDRERPIARIVPIRRERQEVVITPRELDPATLRTKRIKPAKWPKSSLSILLEDRRKR
jgi:prevent-host-death family protein